MPKESSDTDRTIEDLVEQAKTGNRDVLEEIVRRIQDKIYGLAIRMLFIPADAEDAAQEILVKVITHLSTFKGESRFDTWVYRIASNHLLTTRKCRAERWQMTFDTCVHAIEERTLHRMDETFPFIEAEQKLIVKEARLACVHYLLLCLKRELRLALILGEVFGVSSTEGGKILGLSPAAYRQRLSRGRKQILDFLLKQCSLINPENPCQCETLAAHHVMKKYINPGNLYFATHPCYSRQDDQAENLLKELNQMSRAAMLIRNHPDYTAPGVFVASMRSLIDSGRFRLLGRECQ